MSFNLLGIIKNVGLGIGSALFPGVIKNRDEIEAEKLRVIESLTKLDQAQLPAALKIILTQITSDSKLTRNTRPLMGRVLILIVFNHFILSPYLNAFHINVINPPIPEYLWILIFVIMGGLVADRTILKGIKTWKNSTLN